VINFPQKCKKLELTQSASHGIILAKYHQIVNQILRVRICVAVARRCVRCEIQYALLVHWLPLTKRRSAPISDNWNGSVLLLLYCVAAIFLYFSVYLSFSKGRRSSVWNLVISRTSPEGAFRMRMAPVQNAYDISIRSKYRYYAFASNIFIIKFL